MENNPDFLNEELNDENYIQTAPISVPIEKTAQILEQLKKSVFEIKYNDKITTGFLCKIPLENKLTNTLVMNYQMINEKFLKENKILTISLNDNKEKIDIKLDLERLKRKIYFNNINITIIEVFPEDNINENDFLELDDNLLKEDSEIFYKYESIYLLQYKEENIASVSYGLIMEGDQYELTIYSDIGTCSLGAPILNMSTNKVIGICKDFVKEPLKRKGINFKGIMKKYRQNNKKEKNIEKKNEIRLSIKVGNTDTIKKVYFMYNNIKNIEDENTNSNLKRSKSGGLVSHFINDSNLSIYINDKKNKEIKYYFEETESKLYTVTIKFNEPVQDCSHMFYNCDQIISIDFSNFDSSQVDNMSYLFYGCVNLRYINFANINTKKVTNTEKMFYCCYNLTHLDLSDFDVRNVTYMDFMFYNTKRLEHIIFSDKFDTSSVINMDYMFSGCFSLKDLNLSSFNTDNVTNMTHMFYKCQNLEKLEISHFKTDNVTNMDLMFNCCKKLEKLDLSKFVTKNVTNMGWMFAGCSNLKELNLSNFNTENVRDMEQMFSSCKKLKKLDLSSFNTKNVLYMDFMFDLCRSLEEIIISSSFNTEKVTNMRGMFYGCENLKFIDFNKFNTSNVTNMKWMFHNCKSFETLN